MFDFGRHKVLETYRPLVQSRTSPFAETPLFVALKKRQ